MLRRTSCSSSKFTLVRAASSSVVFSGSSSSNSSSHSSSSSSSSILVTTSSRPVFTLRFCSAANTNATTASSSSTTTGASASATTTKSSSSSFWRKMLIALLLGMVFVPVSVILYVWFVVDPIETLILALPEPIRDILLSQETPNEIQNKLIRSFISQDLLSEFLSCGVLITQEREMLVFARLLGRVVDSYVAAQEEEARQGGKQGEGNNNKRMMMLTNSSSYDFSVFVEPLELMSRCVKGEEGAFAVAFTLAKISIACQHTNSLQVKQNLVCKETCDTLVRIAEHINTEEACSWWMLAFACVNKPTTTNHAVMATTAMVETFAELALNQQACETPELASCFVMAVLSVIDDKDKNEQGKISAKFAESQNFQRALQENVLPQILKRPEDLPNFYQLTSLLKKQ